MDQKYLQKLARLAVRGGVNLQKGQPLMIMAPVEAYDLVRLCTKEAYDAGAKEVTLRYKDDQASHMRLLYADRQVFDSPNQWTADMLNASADDNSAFLYIVGEDPNLMKDTDPALALKETIALNEKASRFRDGLDEGRLSWSIIPYAHPDWAKVVYPDLEEQEAVEALWKDLFTMCRIDENDPLENWKAHNDRLRSRVEILNNMDLEKLHYESSNGTDLWVGMPEGYLFAGGSTQLQNGLIGYCNIPTEEIFSAPHCDQVNGKLVSTLPLNLDGTLVEDLVFTFQDGKVIDVQASSGLELIQNNLAVDEGSCRLGEVALVPKDSPISKLSRIYFNTLVDENASCHFALGKSYAECMENGLELDKEELKARGMNDSKIHIDFMVGADDLKITGYTRSGQAIPIFVDGKFSEEFE